MAMGFNLRLIINSLSPLLAGDGYNIRLVLSESLDEDSTNRRMTSTMRRLVCQHGAD